MSELTVRDGSMALHAKMAMDVRKQIVDLESQETNAKDLIKSEVMAMAEAERVNGNYVSIIRIVPEDSAPVRAELRVTNGALNITDKPKLETLFGGATDDLFEQDTQIGTIVDPQAIIEGQRNRPVVDTRCDCKERKHSHTGRRSLYSSPRAQERVHGYAL